MPDPLFTYLLTVHGKVLEETPLCLIEAIVQTCKWYTFKNKYTHARIFSYIVPSQFSPVISYLAT